MKRLFTIYCLIIISSSCTSVNKNDPINEKVHVTIDISEKNKNNFYSLESIIDSVRMINLESKRVSLISNIDKVIHKNNLFYVYDGKFSAIKVFNDTGKYLFDVGKLGKRVGEYIKLQDLIYYPPHNSLLVLCNEPRLIQEYTLSGRFKKSYSIGFYATKMAIKSPNERYFFTNQIDSKIAQNNNLLFVDSLNFIKGRSFMFAENINFSNESFGGLYNTNNEIFFNPPLSNTLYKLNNGLAQAEYKMKFDGKDLPSTFKSDEDLDDNIRNYDHLLSNFAQNDQCLGFAYLSSGAYQLAFYNKKTKHIAKNDIKFNIGNVIFSMGLFDDEENFISVLDTRLYLPFLLENLKGIDKRFPKISKSFLTKSANDNPYLIVYSLKDF